MHQTIPTLLVLTILFIVVRHLLERWRQRKLAKELQCEAAPAYPIMDFLGIRELLRIMGSRKSNLMLESMAKRFDVVSSQEGRQVTTFTFQMLNKTALITSNPKNMQAVYATQFSEFEAGEARNGSFRPL